MVLAPLQIVVVAVDILTLAVNIGLTVIDMVFDVAGDPITQEAFDVKSQVTVFPFAKVVDE